MVDSATAVWLDTHLASLDHFFLNIHHFFGEHAGGVLTPLMRVITFLGEKGWIFFLLAFLFMLTANKRDLGVCIFGAVCCGALITNIILKDNIARLRPFENSVEYELWWMAIGSPAEDGFSFPSGHVTACAAGMTAITLMRGKKWIIPSVVIVLLMAISRNYLMAHYPSDVFVAILIGVFSGFVSWFITQLIFRFLNRHRKTSPICAFILEFDIRDVLPFQLPSLPSRKGAKAAPAKAGRNAPAGDEDVKTYPARRRGARADAAADADAPVRTDAPARRRDRSQPAAAQASEAFDELLKAEAPAPAPTAERARPAAKSAPARSGGRHALPESDGGAKKSSRLKMPGGYQGKH